MNKYHIKVYNETISYNSKLHTSRHVTDREEYMYFIDLCEEQEIMSSCPWIGIVDSLNCNISKIDYYISKKMNFLISTFEYSDTNIDTGIISKDFYSSLPQENKYIVGINNDKYMSNYFLYMCLLLLIVSIFISIYKRIIFIISNFTKQKSIQRIKFKETFNYKNCSICLEDFESNILVSKLKCDHIYHEKCISEWISLKNDISKVKCPNCNQNIFTDIDYTLEPLI